MPHMNTFALLVAGATSWIAVQGGAWQPSQETLNQIQPQVEPLLTKQLDALHKKSKIKFADYSFQYQGQQSLERKYVLINAFCRKPKGDLTKDLYYVFDGGLCFFHVKYDPAKNEFYEFEFNGDA